MLPSKQNIINAAVKTASEIVGVTPGELLAKNRSEELVMGRSIVAYVLRETGCFSWKECAEAINKRDHCTAIHAHKKVAREHGYNARIRSALREVSRVVSATMNRAIEDIAPEPEPEPYKPSDTPLAAVMEEIKKAEAAALRKSPEYQSQIAKASARAMALQSSGDLPALRSEPKKEIWLTR